MLKKFKQSKMFQMGAIALSMGLVFIADASASSACLLFWHEPDCPEELIR